MWSVVWCGGVAAQEQCCASQHLPLVVWAQIQIFHILVSSQRTAASHAVYSGNPALHTVSRAVGALKQAKRVWRGEPKQSRPGCAGAATLFSGEQGYPIFLGLQHKCTFPPSQPTSPSDLYFDSARCAPQQASSVSFWCGGVAHTAAHSTWWLCEAWAVEEDWAGGGVLADSLGTNGVVLAGAQAGSSRTGQSHHITMMESLRAKSSIRCNRNGNGKEGRIAGVSRSGDGREGRLAATATSSAGRPGRSKGEGGQAIAWQTMNFEKLESSGKDNCSSSTSPETDPDPGTANVFPFFRGMHPTRSIIQQQQQQGIRISLYSVCINILSFIT